jgi:ParB family chromosome partitioning protein
VKATDAKARFVGREAYVGAGGRIERDLFGEDADESWIDVELIEQLAAQKLEAAAEALAAEQKLAFVTPVLATHVPYDGVPAPRISSAAARIERGRAGARR